MPKVAGLHGEPRVRRVSRYKFILIDFALFIPGQSIKSVTHERYRGRVRAHEAVCKMK
jgi:hypothetical protein